MVRPVQPSGPIRFLQHCLLHWDDVCNCNYNYNCCPKCKKESRKEKRKEVKRKKSKKVKEIPNMYTFHYSVWSTINKLFVVLNNSVSNIN